MVIFFSLDFREIFDVFFGSSENGRDPRLRKPSAPEASKLLKDQVFKNIRKNNDTSQVLSSWDWVSGMTKVHCIAMVSIR